MLLTIPVLRAGSPTNIRKSWECPGGVLPGPIMVCSNDGETHRFNPGDGVVKELRYANVCVHKGEPWVVVWVTMEVPDGKSFPIEFQDQNPKLGYTSEHDREFAMRRVQNAAKEAMTSEELLKHHAALMADSEPDEVTP